MNSQMPFAQREGNLPGKVRRMTEKPASGPVEEIQALTLRVWTEAGNRYTLALSAAVDIKAEPGMGMRGHTQR